MMRSPLYTASDKRLPVKLGQEPLVDAMCGLVVASTVNLTTVLPGFLFSKLPNSVINIHPPRPAAQMDDSGQFVPVSLVTLEWNDNYFVNIGPNTVTIGCRLPYPGWLEFKREICQLFEAVAAASFIRQIDRYSIKYTNLLKAESIKEQFSMLDGKFQLGGHDFAGELAQLRFELREEGITSIVNVGTGATLTLVNELSPRIGLILDVDTIAERIAAPPAVFTANLGERLDTIRQLNKRVFFNCLTQGTIDALDPTYE